MRTPIRRGPAPLVPFVLLAGLAMPSCGKLSDPGVTAAPATDGVSVDAAALTGDDADLTEYVEDASSPLAWEAGIPADAEAGLPSPTPTAGDAAADAVDAPPEGACDHPPGTGDLVIDEMMIESVAGAGDDGEWLEITGTAACALDLHGLHGEAPVGAKVHTFDVGVDAWLPPGGTFLVADSADPAIDHDLPGMLFTWSGAGGDVLRNDGGTVTLTLGSTLVTSLTWPKLKLVVGTSVELPASCDPSRASDFSVWQYSHSSWFPDFYGTPNAPNEDVPCPP